MAKTVREEGHYTIKRVNRLPTKGNSNWLYVIKADTIDKFYRWLPEGTYEEISLVGAGGSTSYVSNVALNGTDLEFTGTGLAFSNTVDLSSLGGGSATGLEALDEGNGVGWRLIGRDPLNAGNIGLNAVDFTKNNNPNNTGGATGENSFAQGLDSSASGNGAVVFGQGNTSSGHLSFAAGVANLASGRYSTAFGIGAIASNAGSFAHNGRATGVRSFTSNGTASGDYSEALGSAAKAFSAKEIALGFNNTTYVPSSTDTFELSDRILSVGIGGTPGSRSIGTEKDALIILKDGTITAPSLTPALITATGNPSLITKEYGDANYIGGGTMTTTSFTPYLTLGSTDGQAAVEELKDELDAAILLTSGTTIEEKFTAIGGETDWVLSNTPSLGFDYELHIGGILQDKNVDYNLVGDTINFLGINNPLTVGDKVHIKYDDITAPLADSPLLKSSTIIASRDALLTDKDGVNESTSASDITITIPLNATVAFPIGALLPYKQNGRGNIIINYAGGVIGTVGQTYCKDQTIVVWKTGTDTWELYNPPQSKQYDGYALSAADGVPANASRVEVDRVVGTKVYKDVRVSLNTTDTTTDVTVDVKKNGVSIFDTLITIDSTELTSTTATTAFDFTASASSIVFTDDDEISFDVSNVTDATGLKIKMIE